MDNNVRIRRAARAAGIPLWRVAQEVGVSEPTITRWLRVPLTAEREEKLEKAIIRLDPEGGELK